jgi:hypothetical protein
VRNVIHIETELGSGCAVETLAESLQVEALQAEDENDILLLLPEETKRNEMTPSRRVRIRVGFIRRDGYGYRCMGEGGLRGSIYTYHIARIVLGVGEDLDLNFWSGRTRPSFLPSFLPSILLSISDFILFYFCFVWTCELEIGLLTYLSHN